MDILEETEKTTRLNGNKEENTKVLIDMIDLTETTSHALEIIHKMSKKKGNFKEALNKMILHAYNKYMHLSTTEIQQDSYKTPIYLDINMIRPNTSMDNHIISVLGSSLDVDISGYAEELDKSGYNQIISQAQPDLTKNNQTTGKSDTTESEFLKFLKSLLKIVEGSIHMEYLRLFISDAIKQIFLSENNTTACLNTLYAINPETFSSLNIRDILTFQLEQMRIAILSNNLIKAENILKRISIKNIKNNGLFSYFLNRIIFIYSHYGNYLELSHIFNYLKNNEIFDFLTRQQLITLSMLYAILSLDKELVPARLMIHNIISCKLSDNNDYQIGKYFINNILININFDIIIKRVISLGVHYFLHFLKYVKYNIILYNINVISFHYSKIRISQAAEITGTQKHEILIILQEMIRNRTVYGNIVENMDIVEFENKKEMEVGGVELASEKVRERLNEIGITLDKTKDNLGGVELAARIRECPGVDSIEAWSRRIEACLDGIIKINHSMNGI
ncbi:26S proteasome regulatory subunit N5 [Nematocida ausubeli]|nr:26S proteasome regulatory subunit N5 [Nematocida ausubeli]KAI5163064.1 26S proteasome regulatory subunit N5 [Nematocida ausubeli]